jgi:hypothetical protein
MTEAVQVSMVPIDHVDRVWDDVKGYLADAAKYTYGRYDLEDIYDSIMQYNHTLWIAFTDDKIIAAVVTNILHYPKKTCLSGVFLGGDDLKAWKGPMLEMLQKWAFDNKCDGFEMCGRMGWARALKDEGYQALWQTCELPVAESGLGVQNG